MPPILEPPIDIHRFPIFHPFWVDETENSTYRDFYTVFNNHHPGVDFDTPVGTEVTASFSGIVVRNEFHKGMGNVVSVRNGNTIALYAHLEKSDVKLGQILKGNERIGLSGNTGTATTGAHLHFELRDLTKSPLKDSVFEPIFNQEIKNFQPTFNYVVNNTNSQKTFVSLAVSYFGLPSYVSLIRDHNPKLKDVSLDSPLPQGQSILIPSPRLETGN